MGVVGTEAVGLPDGFAAQLESVYADTKRGKAWAIEGQRMLERFVCVGNDIRFAYDLVRPVAMGGSGVISEVTDRRLHRTRALKTPRPDPDDSALFDKTLRFTTRRSRGSPRSARGSRPTPAAAGETSALRDVAAQLRDVASSLRSPVLDHLGIGPALEDLGEALSAAYPGRRVLVAVDDFTARGGRPPSDVEVAAFRVAQEASGNALRHATGPTVRITATVAAGAVDVAVADDGPGIDRDAAARARRGGHFGLDSMRERAAAVGDRVEIESGASGTTVRFAWERGA